jgi:hypothetical protein
MSAVSPTTKGGERQKLRAAEWLYRWNLSNSIVGIVFTILTFLGVFTLLLGPVLAQVGLSYLETALILLVLVVVLIVGFGLFLDRYVKFWSAQATVGTVRNPYLVSMLYQKELLTLKHVQVPQINALLALVETMDEGPKKREIQDSLRSSLRKLGEAISNKEWPVEANERTY